MSLNNKNESFHIDLLTAQKLAYEPIGLIIGNHELEKESAEYEECDFIIVPSNFVKNSFISEGINPDKLVKIPYGYDSQFFKFSNIRKFSNNKLRLIFAGELSLRKGLHHLLNNFNKLKIAGNL